jgi:uncharacterized protein (DUF1684 family)
MMNELTRFRQQINEFMAHHPQSPLDHEQKATFSGLNYYEEDDAYILEGEVERFPADEPVIEMETSTGDIRPYRRWGRFNISVDGQEAALTIYSDGHGLFLPFKDATNGAETYGAGRYLDTHRPGLEQISADNIRIDFNYAYNPFCTYSAAYSCPLPPVENWLKVPIQAGEKDFK